MDRPLGLLVLLLGETVIDNVPASGGVGRLLRPTQLNSIVKPHRASLRSIAGGACADHVTATSANNRETRSPGHTAAMPHNPVNQGRRRGLTKPRVRMQITCRRHQCLHFRCGNSQKTSTEGCKDLHNPRTVASHRKPSFCCERHSKLTRPTSNGGKQFSTHSGISTQ